MSRMIHFPSDACRMFFICFMVLFLCSARSASAEPDKSFEQAAKPSITISTTPVYQFETPLHNGNVSVFREQTNVRFNRKISDAMSAGLNLTYDFADYHFSGPTVLAGGLKPWGKIHTLNLGSNIRYELAPEWRLIIAPSVSISREDNAGWNNAIGYGGYASLIRDISPNLSLGLGAGVFNNLGRVSYFPGLVILWRITDHLLLSNPLRPGPTGPAGLELSYRLGDGWDVGSGVAYRHNRFRLNNSSFTSEGVGDVTSLPTWVRLSRNLGSNYNLDFYSGMVFGGMMSIDDTNGSRLSSDHHQPAPFLAVTISASF